MRSKLPAVLLVASLLGPGCGGRKPGSPLRPGFNLFSQAQEVQLGREAAQQVRQQVDVVDNQALQEYVRTLGQKLASQPAAGNYPYSFTLINEPSINAFALPGGPIFMHSGLIRAADNEAQVAGVLAHEIAHVVLRHGTNQASKANILQLPAAIAAGVIGQGSVLAQLGQLGIGLGLNSLLLRYSRDAESQADALGARIMAQAGYNPIEMARFFEKLEGEGGPRAPQFLSDHPSPGNRIRAVQAEVQTFPQQPYNASSGGRFERAQAQVAQLPAPSRTMARQLQQAPAAPGGEFRTLQTGRLAMSYPAGWEVLGDADGGTMVVAPRQGLLRNQAGGVDVGYGALLGYYFPGSGANLRQATSELLQRLNAGNPGLQVAGRTRTVRVDGSPGLLTDLSGTSPFGGAEAGILLTVARPDGLFYLVLVAPERGFAQLTPTFEQMLRSIDFRA